MSFKSTGPKTRPDPVKPPRGADPVATDPHPPSWTQSRRSSSSASSIASFHSARFPADEESRMLASSHELKSQANTQFSKQDYSSAISTYDRALAELPSYLDYEMAVLQSNIAACHLKLEQWKEAVESCDKGLDGLERELPTKSSKPKSKSKSTRPETKNENKKESKDTDTDGRRGTSKSNNGTKRSGRLNSDTESSGSDSEAESSSPGLDPRDEDAAVVEIPSDADESSALAALSLSDERKADIHRIRTKLLLRRGRARVSMEPETWTNLSAALEDYKTLQSPRYLSTLPPPDQRTVHQALVTLPPKVSRAKEKEVADMMGKLKDLGNGILKPFGLSTDNFKVTQGEGGGYSLSFDGGGGGGGKKG
ncbi:hypothetical protein PV08_02943 [Exophiala spinifera]|uniref:Tetratricopeptide repeat protein 1 n=1 Tax=Exophiala spinifera TaxID=91928 RepID=A0A0D2C4Y5_9EURO|nr:uncharacterized protein PV08_02943 [Exophiala spinifera]KIW18654.1 hypothetical protein PV08_02943 [Exophiala spinifera]